MSTIAWLTNQTDWAGRLVTIVAAFSLLSMPVNYKGGLELSHAHGLFQFWIPGGHAEGDALNHHAKDGHRHGRDHHDRQPDGASATSSAAPDTPTVSDMGTPAGKSSGIAVTMLLSALMVLVSTRHGIGLSRQRLTGCSLLPELPPPKAQHLQIA